ncbi:MAG: chromate transporter, partial [Firmicutes bacterium]|nr:chromate transporter [Bacillota bacterium]
MKEIFRMFTGFFKIGMFTFGGGLAMLPLIQKMAVDDYKWLTEEEMVDCVAVTQAMPGVIAINTATYIGYKRRGFAGALFSTLGVILPSFMIIICAVLLLSTIGENKYVDSAFTAI